MVFTGSVPAQAASWRETSQQHHQHVVPHLSNRYPEPLGEYQQPQSLYGDPPLLHRGPERPLGPGVRKSLGKQPTGTRSDYGDGGTGTGKLCLGNCSIRIIVSANLLPSPVAPLINMEEFGDLSALLSGRTGSIVDTIVSTDELSTPVFDFKGPFNYLSPERHENHEDDEINIKLESSSIPSNNGDYRHSSYLINNNNHNNNNNVDIFEQMANFNNNRHNSSTTDNGSNVVLHVQQQQQQKVEQSPQDDRYSYISSPELAVPERFDHAYHRAASRPAALHLATFQPPFKAGTTDALVLNTPDVIEGVVSMGTEFNILDLVNNEDITVVSADSEFLTSLASAHTSNPSTPPSKEASRKRARSPSSSSSLHSEEEEGEDEEWMPPTTPTIKYSELDHLPPVKKRRGRPPKRPDSVTSGESGDVSKYRELRDKNNEASRKSRLKRKIKEKEYEREADELQMRNVRLKAQVEELEKMVSTFRNNLFKILVRK